MARTGWKRDPADPNDCRVEVGVLRAQPRRLALASSTGDASLRKHCGPILDQGSTSSCVAHAFLDAEVTTRSARFGEKVELGSRRMVYLLARHQHEYPVTDAGTYPRLAAKALLKFGVLPEHFWPWVPSRINQPAHILLLSGAYGQRKLLGYYRLPDDPQEKVDAAIAALHSGRAFVIGREVGERFMDFRGAGVLSYQPTDPVIGGHMFAVVGVEFAAGRPRFLVKNSWGEAWGASGYAWLDRNWIAADGDDWVVDCKAR